MERWVLNALVWSRIHKEAGRQAGKTLRLTLTLLQGRGAPLGQVAGPGAGVVQVEGLTGKDWVGGGVVTMDMGAGPGNVRSGLPEGPVDEGLEAGPLTGLTGTELGPSMGATGGRQEEAGGR